MKASEILAFVAGAAAATGITLLCTTEKGKEIRIGEIISSLDEKEMRWLELDEIIGG